MLLNNKKLKYTFFRFLRQKSLTKYQQCKIGKTRKKGVYVRSRGRLDDEGDDELA
jgi:hypothetical protein